MKFAQEAVSGLSCTLHTSPPSRQNVGGQCAQWWLGMSLLFLLVEGGKLEGFSSTQDPTRRGEDDADFCIAKSRPSPAGTSGVYFRRRSLVCLFFSASFVLHKIWEFARLSVSKSGRAEPLVSGPLLWTRFEGDSLICTDVDGQERKTELCESSYSFCVHLVSSNRKEKFQKLPENRTERERKRAEGGRR